MFGRLGVHRLARPGPRSEDHGHEPVGCLVRAPHRSPPPGRVRRPGWRFARATIRRPGGHGGRRCRPRTGNRATLEWMPTTALTGSLLSFVHSPHTVLDARRILVAATPSGTHTLIAKIETALGVERTGEVARASDAILLGRGDLLLDIGPIAFHRACEQARLTTQSLGKPFVTGTQLLTSLTSSWLPNRSELDEVSRLIEVGVDGLLLSDETIYAPQPREDGPAVDGPDRSRRVGPGTMLPAGTSGRRRSPRFRKLIPTGAIEGSSAAMCDGATVSRVDQGRLRPRWS
jgi:Pyruvate kinase, barrel domain